METILMLAVAGGVAGAVNVVAGGGSFLTLPLLILMGLPAGTANGTNRLAVLVQSVAGALTFHRGGHVPWHEVWHAIVPSTAGSVLGIWFALRIGEHAFKTILAIIMVIMTLWMMRRPVQTDATLTPASGIRAGTWMQWILWFLVGVYGGFIQAGVGFLILALTSFAGVDLPRGNVIKVVTTAMFTAVSLAVFVVEGLVDWRMGFALAAGTAVGAVIGARLNFALGQIWIRRLVTAAVLLFAVQLLL